jgi:small subunit ribosomal protein S6
MSYYETIFILDSLLTPEEIDKTVQRVQELIEKASGKIINVDKWGKRRLAYEIQKKQYGFYVSIQYEEKGTTPEALQNEFNYNDKVLRYLTYRFDKKKLKQLEKQRKQGQKALKSQTMEKAGTEKSVEEKVPEIKEEKNDS